MMLNPGDMTGKAAIVTGAAAGLGRATALLLAQAGANLCLVDINAEGLEAVSGEVQALGGEVVVRAVNLADSSQCSSIVAESLEAFGRLDALCNIAAVFMPVHTTDMSDEQWDTTLAVNLTAPFKLMRAAIPYLLEHNGAVVNVTSCAAHMGQAYMAAYSSTKAALSHMTRALAMEYIHQPIRFNAVAPGGMMTELTGALRNLPDPDVSLLGRFTPLRGVNEVEDVAQMVAFLATDAARGYHGAVIVIDNGMTVG